MFKSEEPNKHDFAMDLNYQGTTIVLKIYIKYAAQSALSS